MLFEQARGVERRISGSQTQALEGNGFLQVRRDVCLHALDRGAFDGFLGACEHKHIIVNKRRFALQ